MSDEQGPAMICATKIMKSGPARIGKVAGISLPRTVAIVNLVATGVGALVGLGVASVVGSGFTAFLYGGIFGGAAGWFLVTYSPLKGESLLKWAELQLFATQRSRYIDGERVTLSVGTAILPRQPVGKTRLLRSAVRVPQSQYDERGVPLAPANRNVPTDGAIDPLLFAALSLPGESAMSMTPMDDTMLRGGDGKGGSRGRGSSSAAPSTGKPRRKS